MPRSLKARVADLPTREAALALLTFAKESADAFPPLKSTVGGVLFIADIVDVRLHIRNDILSPGNILEISFEPEGMAKFSARACANDGQHRKNSCCTTEFGHSPAGCRVILDVSYIILEQFI